jgi:hypothetical protein
MTTGYIYALSNDDMPGLLKIGMTERRPEDRAKELFTTGVPSPFKVQRAVKVREPLKKEKKIHEILSEHRLPGREFFRVELKMVNNLFDLTEGTEWTEETEDDIYTGNIRMERRDVPNVLSTDQIMDQWIECETEECETVTEFRILYDYFADWCVEVLDRTSNNIPDMASFKKYLKKWQEKSKFGLEYGKKKADAGPNGYEACMKFNLHFI